VVLPGAGILAPGSYSPKCLEAAFSEVRQKMFQRSLIWVIPLVPMVASVGALYNSAGLTRPALSLSRGSLGRKEEL